MSEPGRWRESTSNYRLQPDRPKPIGLHPVRVLERIGGRIKVGLPEAIDGTPVVDIKPRG